MNWMFDNFIFRGISKILECIGVSLLWILFCIPVVTAGAATTALYYTVNKTIMHDRGYAVRGFISSFKSNFKQSTIIWLIFLVFLIIFGADFFIMVSFARAGEPIGEYQIIFLVFGALLAAWALYVFPYIARFENRTKDVLRNTLIIATGNAPTTIILAGLFVMMCYIIYKWTPVIIVLPAVYNILKSMFIEKIFRKYMTPEQIEREQELNGVYYK